MAGAKGVVAVGVAVRGEFGAVFGFALLLALVEADVLKEHHLAILEARNARSGGGIDGILAGEDDGLAEELAEFVRGDLEAEFLLEALTFGATQVAHQDGAPAAVEDGLDGGQGFADAAIIGDDAIFDGHVEVDADEDFLGLDVDLGDGFLGHGGG